MAGLLQVLFTLAYPFIVWLAFTRLETRAVGGLLLGLYGVSVLLRARGSRDEIIALARQHAPIVLLVLIAMLSGNRTLLLLVPMVLSLFLLWTFASSLRHGPPMIERFARIIEDDLPDFCLPYCRKMTKLWCLFLLANAICVGGLALFASLEWWTLYAGFVFYLLLAALLGIETLVRKIWFRYYSNSPFDRGFARLFPPERSANGRRSLAYVAERVRREEIIRATS
jgi:uncharacterized membrane protein